MVRRFTVSVNDELGEKIDKWKDEISPSATFQAAMAKAISEKEGFIKRLKEDATMDQIVERLREEKAAHENTYYTKGKEEGLAWAKRARFADLRYAADVFASEYYEASPVNPDFVFKDEVLGDDLGELLKGDPATIQGYADEYLPDAADRLLDGWLEAVTAFWDEVSSKL